MKQGAGMTLPPSVSSRVNVKHSREGNRDQLATFCMPAGRAGYCILGEVRGHVWILFYPISNQQDPVISNHFPTCLSLNVNSRWSWHTQQLKHLKSMQYFTRSNLLSSIVAIDYLKITSLLHIISFPCFHFYLNTHQTKIMKEKLKIGKATTFMNQRLQNHCMVEVGRDLWRLPGQTPCLSRMT